MAKARYKGTYDDTELDIVEHDGEIGALFLTDSTFSFHSKPDEIAAFLAKAFPSAMRSNSEKIGAELSRYLDPGYSTGCFNVNVLGEAISIPNRLHFLDTNVTSDKLVDQEIIDCLLTRSTDGFVRQMALTQIILLNRPWTIPFVLALVGEYVVEIIILILDHASNLDQVLYADFLTANPIFLNRLRSRVMSYWNCYYRVWPYKNRADYPGFRLLDQFDAMTKAA